MKGFQLSSGAILIAVGLLSLQTELASAAYTMNETCAYVTKGWIADPTSCKGWGYCSGGKLNGTGVCDGDFLFNSKIGACDYPDQVTCTSTVADACKNLDTPQMIANPNDCTDFCYCDGSGNVKCDLCPKNQFYNPTKQACVWRSDYACPADSICRLVPNNQFVGDPQNCGNFISCVDGSGVSSSCGNGQYFNPANGYCQNLNPCDGDNDNGGPSTPTAGPGVLTPLPTVTKTVAKCPAGKAFVTDSQTCFGYYYCDGNTATTTATWSKCPLGTHFNPTLSECVTPYTFRCTYDRCGNINQSFVTQIDKVYNAATACTQYLNCNTQTTQTNGGGSCPSDYSFFDEFQNACVNKNPGYAICKAA